MKQVAVFMMPYMLLALLLSAIDPFNYFNMKQGRALEIRKATASKINYALWKLIEFQHHPCPNIILGDSRANRLDSETIRQISGEEYYGFAFGAGTLPEICDAFWYASGRITLRKVYIAIGFNLYNRFNSANRMQGAIPVIHHPLLYLVNRNVLKAAWIVMASRFRESVEDIEKPKMTPRDFWEHQLKNPVERYYAHYAYPSNYFEELWKVSRFCKSNGIELHFLVLPNHVDLQKKVGEYGLTAAYQRYLGDLQQLGDVYFFDYPNDFTTNRDNFSDPFHIRQEKGLLLIEDIWQNTRRFSKVLAYTGGAVQ